MNDPKSDTAAWEPWQPQLGQPVLMRASAECTVRQTPLSIDQEPGIVLFIDRRPDGHDYMVWSDRMAQLYLCAAIELEPLS